MYKSKILTGFVLLAYILFVIFQFIGNENMAIKLGAIIVPLITLLYFIIVKTKPLLFSLFLIFYSISELLILIQDYFSNESNYFIGNSLYIMAYIFLWLNICKYININNVYKNFKIHLIVLLALNIYIVYVLQTTIEQVESSNLLIEQYVFELIYNIVTLLVLSTALLNYISRDSKKSLYLFFGALCIVFYEVFNIAYLYISDITFLKVLSTTITLLAFYFFYQQSKLASRTVNVNDMMVE